MRPQLSTHYRTSVRQQQTLAYRRGMREEDRRAPPGPLTLTSRPRRLQPTRQPEPAAPQAAPAVDRARAPHVPPRAAGSRCAGAGVARPHGRRWPRGAEGKRGGGRGGGSSHDVLPPLQRACRRAARHGPLRGGRAVATALCSLNGVGPQCQRCTPQTG